MKIKVAEQQIIIDSYATANAQLGLTLANVTKQRDDQLIEFKTAVIRREQLESTIETNKKDHDNALAVFNKECGRIDRLMQKKAGLVVRFANRATERLRKQYEEATRDH